MSAPLCLAALPQEVALRLEVCEPAAVRPPEAEQLAVPRRDREPTVQYSTVQYSTVQYSEQKINIEKKRLFNPTHLISK